MEVCESCKFWDRFGSKDAAQGFCRRYPPVMDFPHSIWLVKQKDDDWSAEDYCWSQPRTEWDDYCGEWRAKGTNHEGGKT